MRESAISYPRVVRKVVAILIFIMMNSMVKNSYAQLEYSETSDVFDDSITRTISVTNEPVGIEGPKWIQQWAEAENKEVLKINCVKRQLSISARWPFSVTRPVFGGRRLTGCSGCRITT